MPKTIAIGLTHPGTVRNHDANAFYIIDTVFTGEPVVTADRTESVKPVLSKRPANKGGAVQTRAVPGFLSDPVSRGLHCEQTLQFFALAAGIGGHGIGDVAACMVLETLNKKIEGIKSGSGFNIEDFAGDFINSANQSLVERFGEQSEVYAGASMVLLCFNDYDAWVVSCGNCSCYRLHSDKLSRLTAAAEYEKETPYRLANYLGKLTMQPEPQLVTFDTGDTFLLTTAGLTGQISDEVLARQLSAPETLNNKPQRLLQQALVQGTLENIAFVIIRVSELAAGDKAESFDQKRKPGFTRHR